MAGKKLSIAPKSEPAVESDAESPASAAPPAAAPPKARSKPAPRIAPVDDTPISSWRVLGKMALVLAASAGLCGVAWQYMRDTIIADAGFAILPSQITLTPAPPWVRSEVQKDVVKKSGLTKPLSILDPELSEEVAKQFALHPWIEQVTAVRVHRPSTIEVDVIYRAPTVMVEVPGGLYPVDRFGVLLPSADFSPIEAARFPRLGGAKATPGAVGSVWGDPVVTDGAKLAALLADKWEAWRLFRITAAERQVLDAPDAPPSFILSTKSNQTRILWGAAPGADVSSQPSAEEKLQRLEKYIADLGALDHSTEPREIDLRPTDRLRITPSLAERPR